MQGHVNVTNPEIYTHKNAKKISQISFSTMDAAVTSLALGSCNATSLSIEEIELNEGVNVGSKCSANNS